MINAVFKVEGTPQVLLKHCRYTSFKCQCGSCKGCCFLLFSGLHSLQVLGLLQCGSQSLTCLRCWHAVVHTTQLFIFCWVISLVTHRSNDNIAALSHAQYNVCLSIQFMFFCHHSLADISDRNRIHHTREYGVCRSWRLHAVNWFLVLQPRGLELIALPHQVHKQCKRGYSKYKAASLRLQPSTKN